MVMKFKIKIKIKSKFHHKIKRHSNAAIFNYGPIKLAG